MNVGHSNSEFKQSVSIGEALKQSIEISDLCAKSGAINAAIWHKHQAIRFLLLCEFKKLSIDLPETKSLYKIAHILYSSTLDDSFLSACKILKAIDIYKDAMEVDEDCRLPFFDEYDLVAIDRVMTSVLDLLC